MQVIDWLENFQGFGETERTVLDLINAKMSGVELLTGGSEFVAVKAFCNRILASKSASHIAWMNHERAR